MEHCAVCKGGVNKIKRKFVSINGIRELVHREAIQVNGVWTCDALKDYGRKHEEAYHA